MDTDKEQALLDIDDPQVPECIREHGRRFRNPARFAVDLGRGEYLLHAEDGELLDMVRLK
ncbi:hypothetical protein ABZN20_08820 [Methylococcus sp. ANG]|uniref:hypothetical protein n=1 Tax=Methylococcus sp. ANG TaxID=3231903 RepID=UPI00345B181E